MIDPKAVEDVVKEVLRKLEHSDGTSKPRLLVITNPVTSIENEISYLQDYWSVIEANKQSFARERLSTIAHAVFLNLNQDTLVKAALGFTDSDETRWLSALIYEQRPITIVLEPRLEQMLLVDEKKHRYEGYLNKLRFYKESLESYGILFQQLEDIKPVSDAPLHENGLERGPVSKKLLVQEDINSFAGDHLVVPKGTIITPLAKDKARELGIMISFT